MRDVPRDRPTIAEIDLACITRNMQAIRKAVGPDCEILGVVKADAYGHGAIPIARTVLNNGATWLGVALVEEGIALRRSGIIAPILVLAQLFPAQAQVALRYNLSCATATYEFAEALSNAAVKEGKKAKCHVKVDTGMGRIGVTPAQTVSFVKRISMLPNIEIEGIFTHFATAEDEDRSFLDRQLSCFNDIISALRRSGIEAQYYHAANSMAALTVTEARFDLVRTGIFIYGLTPVHGERARKLRRELDITRSLSNRGEVLIRGKRFPVVGRVCMDECMISTGDFEVDTEDEVIIIGTQGDEEITAEDVAERAGTVAHEILCGISRRVPRIYLSRT